MCVQRQGPRRETYLPHSENAEVTACEYLYICLHVCICQKTRVYIQRDLKERPIYHTAKTLRRLSVNIYIYVHVCTYVKRYVCTYKQT